MRFRRQKKEQKEQRNLEELISDVLSCRDQITASPFWENCLVALSMCCDPTGRAAKSCFDASADSCRKCSPESAAPSDQIQGGAQREGELQERCVWGERGIKAVVTDPLPPDKRNAKELSRASERNAHDDFSCAEWQLICLGMGSLVKSHPSSVSCQYQVALSILLRDHYGVRNEDMYASDPSMTEDDYQVLRRLGFQCHSHNHHLHLSSEGQLKPAFTSRNSSDDPNSTVDADLPTPSKNRLHESLPSVTCSSRDESEGIAQNSPDSENSSCDSAECPECFNIRRRIGQKPTLLFMPHCDVELYGVVFFDLFHRSSQRDLVPVEDGFGEASSQIPFRPPPEAPGIPIDQLSSSRAVSLSTEGEQKFCSSGGAACGSTDAVLHASERSNSSFETCVESIFPCSAQLATPSPACQRKEAPASQSTDIPAMLQNRLERGETSFSARISNVILLGNILSDYELRAFAFKPFGLYRIGAAPAQLMPFSETGNQPEGFSCATLANPAAGRGSRESATLKKGPIKHQVADSQALEKTKFRPAHMVFYVLPFVEEWPLYETFVPYPQAFNDLAISRLRTSERSISLQSPSPLTSFRKAADIFSGKANVQGVKHTSNRADVSLQRQSPPGHADKDHFRQQSSQHFPDKKGATNFLVEAEKLTLPGSVSDFWQLVSSWVDEDEGKFLWGHTTLTKKTCNRKMSSDAPPGGGNISSSSIYFSTQALTKKEPSSSGAPVLGRARRPENDEYSGWVVINRHRRRKPK